MSDASDLVSILAMVTADPLPVRVARLLTEECAGTTASNVANSLGLPSRFALARRLRATGPLSYAELRQWVLVDQAVRGFESGGATPCGSAVSVGRNPAAFYHLVRRLTGKSWREVRRLGSAWVATRFADRCRERATTVRPSPVRRA